MLPLLLLAVLASAQDFRKELQESAILRSTEPAGPLPDAFGEFLKEKGKDPFKLSNAEAFTEYELYRTGLSLPRKGDPNKRGLLFHGLDFSSGDDLDTEAQEPYLSEGLDRLLDWDVRLKLREDSAGFKAKYRHPEVVEQLTVSFRRHMDVPEALGVGEQRDKVYELVNKEPRKKKEGYDLGVSAVLDEHWGVSAAHGERQTEDFWTRHFSFAAGFSPLGRNDGERWNYAVHAGVNHVERDTAEDAPEAGFGYSAGLAFTRALDDVPIPYVRDYFWLERGKATLACSDSELDPFSIRAAVGLSARLTKHLRLSGEASCTYIPSEKELDFDTSTGVDIKF